MEVRDEGVMLTKEEFKVLIEALVDMNLQGQRILSRLERLSPKVEKEA